MTSSDSQNAPPSLSPELWELWKHHADELYKRDGTSSLFPHGGHDIVNNSKLRETLEDLAKIYLPMCVEKFGLLKDKARLDEASMDSTDMDENLIDSMEIADSKIQEFDQKLLMTNAKSMRRILSENSGLDEEARRELISPEARRKLALDLLAPVIKYSVRAAMEHSGYDAFMAAQSNPLLLKTLEGFVPKSVGPVRD